MTSDWTQPRFAGPTRPCATCGLAVAVLVLLAAAVPAPARADDSGFQRLAESGPPTGQDARLAVSRVVARYGDVTAWFETKAGNSTWRLVASIGAVKTVLPVRPFDDERDIDLGPDASGGVVAAYSRCARTIGPPGKRRVLGLYPPWQRGRGCDLYRFDFSSMSESKIQGASTSRASEFLPTIWRDRIAFGRVYEKRSGRRGLLPYIYVRRLDGGGPSRRLPGGSRGTMDLPGPARMDLRGGRLSFVWNYHTNRIATFPSSGVSELRMDTIGGSHRVISSAEWGTRANPGIASYLGGQIVGGKLRYGFQRMLVGEGFQENRTSLRGSYDISSGKRSLASAPELITDFAADGGQTAVAAKLTDDVVNRILLGPSRP